MALLGLFAFVIAVSVAFVYWYNSKTRGWRAAAPPAVVRRAREGSLPDRFDAPDLPFGVFHGRANTVEELRPGTGPLGGRVWTFKSAYSSTDVAATHFCHALVEVPDVWPALGVEKRHSTLLTLAGYGIAGLPEITPAGVPEFDIEFVARSEDAHFGTSFLSEPVQRWLLAHAGDVFMFEISAGLLLAGVHGRGDDAVLAQLLSWIVQLLEQTPIEIWPGGHRQLVPGPAAG